MTVSNQGPELVGAPPPGPTGTSLYLRKISLIVYGTANQGPELVGNTPNGIDLSNMRIRFQIQQTDGLLPNTAIIRVYNLAGKTAASIANEYQKVALQAGYENGVYALIFSGSIKQVKRGRESAVDNYVEIAAGDADEAAQFAVVNATLAAGAKATDKAKAIAKPLKAYGVTLGDTSALTVGGLDPQSLRPTVLYGLAVTEMNKLASAQGCLMSIQNGVVKFTKLTGYNQSKAVVLTAKTGMIGIPEATNGGIEVRCLLNPLIKIGTRIQIDNKSINTTTITSQGFPDPTQPNFVATVTNDGFYRALEINHVGDSRGQEWYSIITALAVDATAPSDKSVLPWG